MGTKLAQDMANAAHWLASLQQAETGGWGEYEGSHANVLNTAEAVLALLDSGCYASDEAVRRGADYLAHSQLGPGTDAGPPNEGGWARRVAGEQGGERHLPDTIRSSFALLAVYRAGRTMELPYVSKGLDWLLRTQRADGGWGYAPDRESRMFPSCMAMRALLTFQVGDHTLAGQLQTPIARGIAWLQHRRNADGSFGEQPGLVYIHTLHAILVLALARSLGFALAVAELEAGVRWTGQQAVAATQWVNEMVEICDDDLGCYTYTHVTPALYLSTFGSDLSPNDAIAKAALLVMHDAMDPVSCGFSAKRPVSWATAKSISGLAAVSRVFPAFPEREIPTGQAQGRQYLFLFLGGISVLTTIVALFGNLTSIYGSIMVLTVCACLLVYGVITEQTFLQVLVSRRKLEKRVASK